MVRAGAQWSEQELSGQSRSSVVRAGAQWSEQELSGQSRSSVVRAGAQWSEQELSGQSSAPASHRRKLSHIHLIYFSLLM